MNGDRMDGQDGPYGSGSVLSGMADVRFRTMVTPRLIGWFYVAALAWVGFGTLFVLLLLWGVAGWAGGGWYWLAPVFLAGGIGAALLVRLLCEWVLMAFTRGRPLVFQAPNGHVTRSTLAGDGGRSEAPGGTPEQHKP